MSRFLFAALLLTALPLAGAAPSPPTSPVVVLNDGTRYTLSKPYEIRGRQALFSLAKGPLVSVAASEIDLEATKRAALPPTPAPAVAPETRRTSMTITMAGSSASLGSSPSSSGVYAYGNAPAGTGGGPVAVRGYTRANGTYVAPHTRSAPSSGRKK